MDDIRDPGKWRRLVENTDIWLNRLSNVAIVIVAVVGVAYYAYGQHVRRGPARAQAAEFKKGDVLYVKKLKMQGAGLLLVSRSTCPACVQSIPFYRGLQGIPITAVASEPLETNREFLQKNGIHVSSLLSLEDSGLDVPFVPTLIAVDADGRVIKAWRGKLSKEDESEVSRILKGVSP